MPQLSVSLLGALEVRLAERAITTFEYDKVRALLAYLMVEADHPHRREALVGLLWPEHAERAARQSLSQALLVLRRAIADRTVEPPFLLITPQTLQFNRESDAWLDMARFTALVDTVHHHSHVSLIACESCLPQLEEAVALYQGDFLAGFSLPDCPEFETWITLQRERLRQQALDALDQLADAYLHCGEYALALKHARSQLELDAWRESAHRQAIAALVLGGQRTAALAQYETCAQTLRTELDVAPEPATTALYEHIKAAEVAGDADIRLALHTEMLAPAPGAPPFKGMDFFDVDDAALFFGREALTANLVKRLQNGGRFLAVVGASGSGKSSLVRAGLAATLQREGWDVRVLTPGLDPLKDLQITQSANQQILVVDQFEELFTLCHDPAIRQSFVDDLLGIAAKEALFTHIVITLRADFYHHCAQFDALRTALEQNQVYIGQMKAAELRRAIEEPACQNHWAFEPGLVDVILRDIGADVSHPPEPGALPLLSHALLETWKRRQGRTLTLAGYSAASGVRGAIAKTAEVVYQGFDTQQRAVARTIFLQLTELGEGTQDTRRRPLLREIHAYHEDTVIVDNVLRTLSNARLITTDRETVQVAHEALIREWPKLREWLDESRADVRMQRWLETAAKEWVEAACEPSFLLQGTRLTQYQEWAEEGRIKLLQNARAYLETSIAAQEAREAEEVARHQAALQQASAGLAAQALAELDGHTPERGVLLALSALEQYPYTPQAEHALACAIHANRPCRVLKLPGDIGAYSRIKWSPDGTYLAVSGSRGPTIATLWEPNNPTGTPKKLTREAYDVCLTHDVAWSPDGERLVTSRGGAQRSECHAIEVWDVQTETVALRLAGHQGDQGTVDWAPDGTAILTAGMDGKARIWDAATGAERLTITVMADPPTGSAFYFDVIGDAAWSPQGDQIVTAAADKTARVWDATTGMVLHILGGHTGPLTGVTWSPEGTQLATSSRDGAVRVWDLATGEVLRLLSNHKGIVRSVAWSPNGRRLATAGEDGTVRVWRASTGIEEFVFRGATAVWHVVWAPDSQRLAIKGARVWVLDFFNEPSRRLYGNDIGESRCAMWSPDGKYILTHSDATAWLWDVGREHSIQTFKNSRYFHQPWSPDGARIVTSDEEGPPRIWDVKTGKALIELQPPSSHAFIAAWSPDGARIGASLAPNSQVAVWEAVTGEVLVVTPEIENGGLLYGPMWSPQGDYFATGAIYAGYDTPARVWDAATGQALMTLESHNGESTLANWSPDGQRLAITYEDGAIKIWDVSALYQTSDAAVSSSNLHKVPTTRATAGQMILTCSGHVGRAWWVSWSPNGKRLASGGADNTVRVWDATTGEELYQFQTPSQVLTLDWSPDGKYLVAGGRYTTPMLWRVWQSTEELIAYARKHYVSREPTPEERTQFMLPER